MTDEATTRRVLVVDDDPLILEVLRTILHLRDLEVSCAEDGVTGLELLATDPLPHVVVCDVMMPGIDGLEVCRRIKSDPRTAPVPVILLTARDRAEDRAAGAAAGCDDYVTKPFSPLALTDLICEYAGLGPPRGSAAGGTAPGDG